MMKVMEITEEQFEKEVINEKKEVLVDFYANWCGPCKMLRTVLEDIAKENNNIKIVSIDVDEAESLAMSYEVFSIPCLIKFKDGKAEKRSVGFKPREEIEKLIGE